MFSRILQFGKRTRKKITGTGNSFINEGYCSKLRIEISGNNNSVVLKKGVELYDVLIYVRGNNHKILIENDCKIRGGELWIEDNDCLIQLGAKTTIESAHLAVTEDHSSIIIGEDCMLANHIEIRTGDSHSIIDVASGKRINPAANVTLADHVWIGAHAKILKGVSIGAHSIVATGAIVTQSIPDHSLAAGIPAKIIKNDVSWQRERI